MESRQAYDETLAWIVENLYAELVPVLRADRDALRERLAGASAAGSTGSGLATPPGKKGRRSSAIGSLFKGKSDSESKTKSKAKAKAKKKGQSPSTSPASVQDPLCPAPAPAHTLEPLEA